MAESKTESSGHLLRSALKAGGVQTFKSNEKAGLPVQDKALLPLRMFSILQEKSGFRDSKVAPSGMDRKV